MVVLLIPSIFVDDRESIGFHHIYYNIMHYIIGVTREKNDIRKPQVCNMIMITNEEMKSNNDVQQLGFVNDTIPKTYNAILRWNNQ